MRLWCIATKELYSMPFAIKRSKYSWCVIPIPNQLYCCLLSKFWQFSVFLFVLNSISHDFATLSQFQVLPLDCAEILSSRKVYIWAWREVTLYDYLPYSCPSCCVLRLCCKENCGWLCWSLGVVYHGRGGHFYTICKFLYSVSSENMIPKSLYTCNIIWLRWPS